MQMHASVYVVALLGFVAAYNARAGTRDTPVARPCVTVCNNKQLLAHVLLSVRGRGGVYHRYARASFYPLLLNAAVQQTRAVAEEACAGPVALASTTHGSSPPSPRATVRRTTAAQC